ncbi:MULTISPECIES: recombinase family protein [Dyadobacter]|uniref:recombinase family protein n=1 Tax=Dyadobacter TaxID=120831 RepID=UPI001E486A0A|nr:MULTISPECIES: recombinase family protein [Dyadobacter]
MTASLAQFESSLISQRVKVGMARAREQGKRISRLHCLSSSNRKFLNYKNKGFR